jgi:PST family polysaccharide transporter
MGLADDPRLLAPAIDGRDIATNGRSLRQHTARGATINGAFLVALSSLGLLKGYIVAAFLTRADYGIWGILVVGLGTLTWLKGAGVSDKYIQQAESDQQLAFQRAFTVELVFTAALMLICAAAIPVLALAYGSGKMVLPALVIVLLYLPTAALQSPRWVLYRRMEFVRQRTLEAVEPVVAVLATVILAVGGAGYWSLVVGTVLGGVAGSVAVLAATPYPLALRYERGTLREYLSFTWPLTLAGAAGLIIAQASLLVPNWALGLSAVGVVTLASSISLYAQQLDQIVTDTMYPAICAVRERTEVLFETFVKSNRIALMWGLPFGVGVAIFAADLVHFVLGSRWIPAIGLIQVFGLVAAANQIGFNWSAFYRALGRTRPVLVSTAVTSVAFVASVVPLTLWKGLTGFGWSMAIMTVALLASRGYYLKRLFAEFGIARHVLRAVLPTIPAVLLVLALRALEAAHRGAGQAVLEFAAYGLSTVGATLLLERKLLSELRGYLSSSKGDGERHRETMS